MGWSINIHMEHTAAGYKREKEQPHHLPKAHEHVHQRKQLQPIKQ